jgi:hypothetical protein
MTRRTTTLLATLGAAMITTTSGAGDGPTADLFWIQRKNAHAPATAAQVEAAEKRLGVRLPAAYVERMRRQNGGYTRYGGVKDPATGRVEVYVLNESLLRLEELRTLADVAEDVDFGDTPDWTKFLKNAGKWIMLSRHGTDWFLCLDYTAKGGPAVVSLDTSGAPRERFRIESFEAFNAQLVYDGSAAGSGHYYAIDAPLAEEAALVKALERAFSVILTGGPDQYSWFDLERGWSPPLSTRPFFQLQPNRDRRGGLQLPERPQAGWVLRVVDARPPQSVEIEKRLARLGYPVTLVHTPPAREP